MQNMNSSLDAKLSQSMDSLSLRGNGENPVSLSQENFDFSIFSSVENNSSQPLFRNNFSDGRALKKSFVNFSRSRGDGHPSPLFTGGINQNLGYPKENVFQYSSTQGFAVVTEDTEKSQKTEIFEKPNTDPHVCDIWGSTGQIAEKISTRPENFPIEPKQADDLQVLKLTSPQSAVRFHSKNLLSFLFWVFFYDSQANGEHIMKNKSEKRKLGHWVRSTLSGGLSFKTFFKPGNFGFKTKLKLKKKHEKLLGSSQKNGVSTLTVFFLLSLVYLGFKGSKSKFFVYQERILTLSNKQTKTTQVLESRQTNGTNVQLEDCNHSVLPSSILLPIPRVQNAKTRFFAYSPLQMVESLKDVTMSDGSHSDQFSNKGLMFPFEKQAYFLPQFQLWPTGLFSNTNVSLDSIIRSFICIASQYLVFCFITKFISENHLGRSNPLRQKEFQNNQTRIFWPNKRKFFILKRKELTKELLTLPGTQEIWPLIEVLIESLNKPTFFGKELRSSTKTFRPDDAHEFTSPALALTKPLSFSLSPPKGYLFVGPPGTGKTLLAREIAQLSNVPFLCVSASEIQKQIEIGTRIGALRLRKVFDEAHALNPCILFFDEIDAIAQRQSQHDSKLFTEFLIQMDSWGGGAHQKSHLRKGKKLKSKLFSSNLFRRSELPPSSVILGTTNYLDRLDSAFVRSGRFDRIIALSYPSKNIRFEILTFYLRGPEERSSQPSVEDRRSAAFVRPREVSGPGLFAPSPRDTDTGLNQKSFPAAAEFVPKTFGGENFKFRTKSKVFLGQTLGLNYFSFVTEGFSQAHLAKLVNESLLFSISLKASVEEAKQSEDNKNQKLFSLQKTAAIDHSFFSLLYGLKQMLIHRKNLPQ